MVFAINPGTQEKMNTFIANAAAAGGAAAPPAATTSTPPPATTAPAPSPDATPPGTTTAPAPDAPPTTPTGTGKEIIIEVGNGGLTYKPETATAVVGDTLIFQFMGGAHTVTESTFAAPCVKKADAVDSGPVPAAGLTGNYPNFTYPVTDISKPVWFYCATGNHCRSGMVFSLNAPATGNTHAAYKALAMGGSAAGGTVSGSNSATAGGAQPTGNPGDSASSLVGSASSLLIAGALAALLL